MNDIDTQQEEPRPAGLQPLLDAATVVLRAPVQAWSDAAGSVGGQPIHGAYIGDTRFVSRCELRFDGAAAEHIATIEVDASTVDFVGLLRHADDPTADPRTRVTHRRAVDATSIRETIRLESGLDRELEVEVRVRLAADLARMDDIKSGRTTATVEFALRGKHSAAGAVWGAGGVSARLTTDADVQLVPAVASVEHELELCWPVTVPANGETEVAWVIDAHDENAVVGPATSDADWRWPEASGDIRLDAWLKRAAADLDTLRMSTVEHPESAFLAAGAPWFFTLFGRDSLWAARLLVPLGGTLARDTLRVLAGLQGTRVDDRTGEQPGKIPHELRRAAQEFAGEGISLPPLYYGTIDATALWICLLCDAADAGMPESELRELLPALEAALAWHRDYGDADGDGLLEYVNTGTGGLANQGWKDSGDSVQWEDGRLADPPIALCEVQAYAYEAATRGASLLDRLGQDGSEWRDWAQRLRAAFAERFWVDDSAGAYPAIALDASKRAVDSLTSNIGHLLGTGLLDDAEEALVAARLVSDELSSGYGLRTLATGSTGYWPLSYHGGSVWAHDTAIAIRGLLASGHRDEARVLGEGLLRAAESFDYRMPELHAGDAVGETSRAIPYPAACRPQAWSAAAVVAVYSALRAD